MMRLTLTLLLIFWTFAAQSAVQIKSVRTSQNDGVTRIVFDLSKAAEHHLFTLSNPDRVVIDIPDAKLAVSLAGKKKGILSNVRGGKRNGKDLRIVLDLSAAATAKSFVLKPGGGSGHRLVVDLRRGTAGKKAVKTVKSVTRGKSKSQARDVVIAIDAGHGGKDPGAQGHGGLREKHAVLALARKLAAEINKKPGMKARLTRNHDIFLTLRQRIKKARKFKADMFVSLHADAFKDPRANGSSVYVLSNRGASTEAAQWLARHENAADLMGGVTLDDKDNQVAQVLLDLSQEATIDASIKVASRVLKELKTVGKVHRKQVERAGFVVLKSPDIPSILIETAFISNPSEERLLRDNTHLKRMAAAIARGLNNYFKYYAPPGTRLAMENGAMVARNP